MRFPAYNIITNYLGYMDAPVHKNTNVPLILIVCDAIFCMLAKHIIGDFSGFLDGASTFFPALRSMRLRGQKSLGLFEKHLGMADYSMCFVRI
jgi:hypothetical protein